MQEPGGYKVGWLLVFVYIVSFGIGEMSNWWVPVPVAFIIAGAAGFFLIIGNDGSALNRMMASRLGKLLFWAVFIAVAVHHFSGVPPCDDALSDCDYLPIGRF